MPIQFPNLPPPRPLPSYLDSYLQRRELDKKAEQETYNRNMDAARVDFETKGRQHSYDREVAQDKLTADQETYNRGRTAKADATTAANAEVTASDRGVALQKEMAAYVLGGDDGKDPQTALGRFVEYSNKMRPGYLETEQGQQLMAGAQSDPEGMLKHLRRVAGPKKEVPFKSMSTYESNGNKYHMLIMEDGSTRPTNILASRKKFVPPNAEDIKTAESLMGELDLSDSASNERAAVYMLATSLRQNLEDQMTPLEAMKTAVDDTNERIHKDVDVLTGSDDMFSLSDEPFTAPDGKKYTYDPSQANSPNKGYVEVQGKPRARSYVRDGDQ